MDKKQVKDKKQVQDMKHKPPVKVQPPKKAGSRVPVFVLIGVAAAAGLVAAYFFFLSPEAQFKRTFKGAVSAFERKNNDELSKFISDAYSDEGGNTKPALLTAAAAIFGSYDKITSKIKRLDVKIIDGGKAELTVAGSVYFKTGSAMYRYKVEQPVTVYMEKQSDGHRRITAIKGQKFDLESITSDMDVLK